MPDTSTQNTAEPLISVVINFYNEAKNVDMAPQALSKQVYRNFEVIFVDDGSSDGSLSAILAKYGSSLPSVKTIHNDLPLGLRKARNQGVKAASGYLTMTLDLHTTFDNLFLQRVVNAFNCSEKIGAVGAKILPYGGKWHHNGYRVFNEAVFKFRKLFQKYEFVFGTAATYKTNILKSINYLSEGEVIEDVDASWKISKAGFSVISLSKNVVYHKGPQDFRSLSRSFVRDGVRASIIFKQHKSQIGYPQSFLRFLWLPVLLLVGVMFPIQTIYAIILCLMLLFFWGITISRSISKSSAFVVFSIFYGFVTSFWLDVSIILILIGKISTLNKLGIDW